MLGTIIGAVGALASSVIGGIKSAEARDKYNKLQNARRLRNEQWYNAEMNKDYTQRTDVQNAITRQRELLDEQIKRGHARSIVGGASPEAAALEKEAANKSLADATADIAADSAKHKDQVEQQYQAKQDALDQQEAQQYDADAAEAAKAGSAGVQAGLGMIGTGDTNLGDIFKGNKAPATGAVADIIDGAAKTGISKKLR